MDIFKELVEKNIELVLIGVAFLLLGIVTKWLYNQIKNDTR